MDLLNLNPPQPISLHILTFLLIYPPQEIDALCFKFSNMTALVLHQYLCCKWNKCRLTAGKICWSSSYLTSSSGLGGLVVSMLASGTQDHGFAPSRSRRIFSGEKILSTPSFGREVKPLAPCRRFVACQRTL
jgi:hypothetical protein